MSDEHMKSNWKCGWSSQASYSGKEIKRQKNGKSLMFAISVKKLNLINKI